MVPGIRGVLSLERRIRSGQHMVRCSRDINGMGVNESAPVGPKQDTKFKPGQSGNPKGREKGSRNRFGEKLFDMLADHVEKHGTAALDKLATDAPDIYMTLMVGLMPKELNVNSSHRAQVTVSRTAEIIGEVFGSGATERVTPPLPN